MDLGVWNWFVATLRAYPELSVFLALAVGFGIGPRKLAGFSLGSVTATLLAAILIGQLGLTIGGPIKSTFFLMFLFAVGFGVGPQFFRGLGKRRAAANRLLAGRPGAVSDRSDCCARLVAGLDLGLRGRAVCRVANHFRVDWCRLGPD